MWTEADGNLQAISFNVQMAWRCLHLAGIGCAAQSFCFYASL
jgi:hypothetical protein